MKLLNSFLQRVFSKLGQLYYESKGYADSLNDLIVNLHFISGKYDVEAVLVPSRSFRVYLGMLQSLGVIARIQIVVIRSSDQLTEFLVKLPVNDKKKRLICARKLYFRFYSQFRKSEIEKNMIII
jgi:hypothetical protein